MRPVAVMAAAVALALAATAVAQRSDSTARPRFSHTQHRQLKVDVGNCRVCHTLDGSSQVLAPLAGKDHRPCADSGCHQSEFFAKQPRICVVCHDGSEPWQALPARLEPAARSEFGGDISHASHARTGAGNASCKACHGDPFAGTPAPRGHDACAPCHGKSAEPAMGNCGDCHRLGEAAARAAQASTEWSVAAQFSHRNHGRGPGGGETECVMCHERAASARSVTAISNPTMQSCDGCHDGTIAFKTTGFGCYRCHQQEQR